MLYMCVTNKYQVWKTIITQERITRSSDLDKCSETKVLRFIASSTVKFPLLKESLISKTVIHTPKTKKNSNTPITTKSTDTVSPPPLETLTNYFEDEISLSDQEDRALNSLSDDEMSTKNKILKKRTIPHNDKQPAKRRKVIEKAKKQLFANNTYITKHDHVFSAEQFTINQQQARQVLERQRLLLIRNAFEDGTSVEFHKSKQEISNVCDTKQEFIIQN